MGPLMFPRQFSYELHAVVTFLIVRKEWPDFCRLSEFDPTKFMTFLLHEVASNKDYLKMFEDRWIFLDNWQNVGGIQSILFSRETSDERLKIHGATKTISPFLKDLR
jgi:hypothetical protein